jgi:hypothetical protein
MQHWMYNTPVRLKTASLVAAFCFAGSLQTAQACVCSGPAVNDREDAAAEFRDAAVVFEGEVSASPEQIVALTGSHAGLSVIQFRILRAYKGTLGDSIKLFDSMAGTDCGADALTVGQKLFVYGFEGEDHKVYIRACDRTTLLDHAGPDIRFARNEPPAKEDLVPQGERRRLHRDPTPERRGASISGVVRRADGGDPSEVFITIWDVDKNGARNSIGLVEAIEKVNADGSFEIRFLPPGKYNVTAEGRGTRSAGKCQADYGNVVLAEHQALSHLRLTCNAERIF